MSNLTRDLNRMLDRLAAAGCTVERRPEHFRVSANGRAVSFPFKLRKEDAVRSITFKVQRALGVKI